MNLTAQQYYNKLKKDGKVLTGEQPVGKSLTVPAQSMSMQEIFLRFSLGQTLENQRPQYWDGEKPTFEDVDETLRPDFDLVDVSEISDRIKESVKKRKGEVEAKKAEPVQHNKAENESEVKKTDSSDALKEV